MELEGLAQADVLRGAVADVMVHREQARQARLRRLAVLLGFALLWVLSRVSRGMSPLPPPDLPFPPE
ncbi:MAG TPA: hypothetical protein VFK43_12785, partial [Acidimicrobiales bacterium]|nr:hypothetical protein [Acidimicrobiales bacterium]